MRNKQALLSMVLVLCLSAATAAPAQDKPFDLGARVAFDIPTQPLESALLELSKQAAFQLVISAGTLPARDISPLSGTMPIKEALDRLLQGTDLSYRWVGEHTVTVVPRGKAPARNTSAAYEKISRIELAKADAAVEAPPAEGSRPAESQKQKADEATDVVVTGTRIRGLVGEQSIQPVLTITAKDIERYGVTSLGEVFRYIPQATSFETGQSIQQPGNFVPLPIGPTANRISATLRGAPASGTLLLVNGRRLPKSGQVGGTLQPDAAYDLSGIPLSAVERIDVLLDGASAIYGADAVGGVINVILKKNYNGTEARVGYENTFDTDVGVKTLALTHGFSVGKFSITATASWEEANSMMWADRWFLRSYDRRFLGGTDLRVSSGGFRGPGVISSVSGNLPGLNTNRVAIPAGSTGRNLTIADYANSGPLPEISDAGEFNRYSSPYERKNASGSLEYRFSRGLTAFAEARWGQSSTSSFTLPLSLNVNIPIPAGAPGNPFGVPIRAAKFFYDLPGPEQESSTVNQGFVAGLRGEFFGHWRYETTAQSARATPEVERVRNGFNLASIAAAFAGPNPPVFLYDSSSGVSPNAPGTIEALTASFPSAERSETRTYDAQADGPLFKLPAGEVRVSFGTEYREEYVDFPIPETGLSVQSIDRYTSGYFGEIRVPLISSRQGWPLLNRLEFSVAARHDRYSDFPQSTNPRYGVLYKPFSWLMLRGSTGEGYKVPTLSQLYQPVSTALTFISAASQIFDPLRGNEPVISPAGGMSLIRVGNPNLRPERSENQTAGVVLEMPFIDGLSFSYDYYDTKYLDRVGGLGLGNRMLLFPESVIRGPNRSTDPPGWAGPVISYEDRPFNIAFTHVKGYDLGLKYLLTTNDGDWTLQATASKTTHNEIRSAPNLAPSTSSTILNLPMQLTGSLTWSRGAFSTTVLGAYRAANTGFTTSIEPSTPSATRWDWQGGYDFDRGGPMGNSLWAKMLAGTRINVTIFNVFDTVPPLRATSYMPDSTIVDARMRRYSINLIRQF